VRCAAFAAALGLLALAAIGPAGAQQNPAPQVAAGTVSVLLGTINAARLAKHEHLVRLDLRLCRIAVDHAIEMVEHNYFAHASLRGLSPFDRMHAIHYRFRYAGENLALDLDAQSVSEALWNSPEHRRNLLEPHYAHVGIAAVPARDGHIVVVEDFSD
jgi:uncharacterized protein YkwD